MSLHRAAVGAVCANSMHMLLYLSACMHTLYVCQACCLLSWAHMHNLHPGCKFAPGCIFGHVNGVLRIYTRVEQIYLYPGAVYAYERKMFNFYTF